MPEILAPASSSSGADGVIDFRINAAAADAAGGGGGGTPAAPAAIQASAHPRLAMAGTARNSTGLSTTGFQ